MNLDKMILPLRPNVCMLLVNNEGKLFVAQRYKQKDVWQFPQGGVEDGLSLEDNVYKELHEELGVEITRFNIIRKLKHSHEYEFKTPPDYAKDKWRGQAQTFWLVQFLGQNSEIKLDRFEPEFEDFKWLTVDELRKIIDPIRLPGYEGALKEFLEYTQESK